MRPTHNLIFSHVLRKSEQPPHFKLIKASLYGKYEMNETKSLTLPQEKVEHKKISMHGTSKSI